MAEKNYILGRWEAFRPRPFGSNWLPCFVCAKNRTAEPGQWSLVTDFASFVYDREGGEQAVKMFSLLGLHAKLDFRDSEPLHVQVKVGACKEHVPILRGLRERVLAQEGFISVGLIQKAIECLETKEVAS